MRWLIAAVALLVVAIALDLGLFAYAMYALLGVIVASRLLVLGWSGNVVATREMSRDLKLLVAAQPTRGVDVGSIEFIHTRIVETRDSGVPVLVVSTELDEVAALADRIAVMYRGAIVGIVPGDTPRDVLGLMMAGETPGDGVAA